MSLVKIYNSFLGPLFALDHSQLDKPLHVLAPTSSQPSAPPEYVHLPLIALGHNGGCLCDGGIYPLNQHQVASSGTCNGDAIPCLQRHTHTTSNQ